MSLKTLSKNERSVRVVQTMAFCKIAHESFVLTWNVNALMAFAPMTSPF